MAEKSDGTPPADMSAYVVNINNGTAQLGRQGHIALVEATGDSALAAELHIGAQAARLLLQLPPPARARVVAYLQKLVSTVGAR